MTDSPSPPSEVTREELLDVLSDLLNIAPDNWRDDEDPEQMEAWDRAFEAWRRATGNQGIQT